MEHRVSTLPKNCEPTRGFLSKFVSPRFVRQDYLPINLVPQTTFKVILRGQGPTLDRAETNHPVERRRTTMRTFPTRGLAARISSLSVSFFLFLCMLPIVPQTTTHADDGVGLDIPVIAPGSAYRQTNLISNVPGLAFVQDPLLVNPWGISLTASSPFWVANNGTSTSTLYRGDVGAARLLRTQAPPLSLFPAACRPEQSRTVWRRTSFSPGHVPVRHAERTSSSRRSRATSRAGTRTHPQPVQPRPSSPPASPAMSTPGWQSTARRPCSMPPTSPTAP